MADTLLPNGIKNSGGESNYFKKVSFVDRLFTLRQAAKQRLHLSAVLTITNYSDREVCFCLFFLRVM